MQRADLYSIQVVQKPEAVLVLCPGLNGNGGDLIRQIVWQEFAKVHNLGLVGLSFASDYSLISNGRGYYFARQGSGELLLQGIRKIYGKDLPLLLYGFSGGAHFTSRFVEWQPDRVVTWCAYSAGFWDEPKPFTSNPPGIVACGERDWNYGASLIYFKQGRALGKPWLWIGLPNTDHAVHPRLEEFVRKYFAAILDGGGKLKPDRDGRWLDIDHKNDAQRDLIAAQPSETAWLPDGKLFQDWTNIHTP